jgi:hypothetical protein
MLPSILQLVFLLSMASEGTIGRRQPLQRITLGSQLHGIQFELTAQLLVKQAMQRGPLCS